MEDVRIFGDEIYQKCQVVYGGRLPQQEITNFMSNAQSMAPIKYDVCREALIHLMTGCNLVQQSELLFVHFFENRVNNWLWFHLKLASFQFSTKNSGVDFTDYKSKSLPLNYTAYFLEDLVQDVTSDNWRANHAEPGLDEANNRVKFAKVLFYVGEFQFGIIELLKS